MSESNPLRYKIDKVPKLSGFSVVSVAAGNYGWFLARGFVHSDQKEFYKYIGQLYGQFVGTRFLVHEVNTFLALIHQDSSADVYVNNGVPTSLLVMAKGDFQQGQLVSIKDFAEITELRFDGIPIKGDDSLVFCFRQRWKFGLFFDFAPVIPNIEKREIDFDQLYKELGSLRWTQ